MNFYAYTDKALKYLRRYYIQRFDSAKMQIRADSLNVISVSKELYADIAAETERVFRKIAMWKYRQISGEDFIIGMWLSGLLNNPDPLTGYVWKNDIDRKRAYFAESVLSGESIDKAAKKALRYWYQSQKQYADIVTDEAAMQAFTDTNTQFVQWVTAHDENVCETCLPRDGMIYPLNHAPRLPAHYGCRCFYRRVNGNAT